MLISDVLAVTIDGTQEIIQGEDLRLTCIPNSENHSVNFTWMFTAQGSNDTVVLSRNQIYFKESMTFADEGNYTCNATSEMGTASVTVELFQGILPPSRFKDPLEEISSILGIAAGVSLVFIIITTLAVYHARVLKGRRQIRNQSANDSGKSIK